MKIHPPPRPLAGRESKNERARVTGINFADLFFLFLFLIIIILSFFRSSPLFILYTVGLASARA